MWPLIGFLNSEKKILFVAFIIMVVEKSHGVQMVRQGRFLISPMDLTAPECLTQRLPCPEM